MADKPALLLCAADQFQTARWITFRPAGSRMFRYNADYVGARKEGYELQFE